LNNEEPIMPADIQAHLPLTPLTLAILLAVADGPLHGYAVLKALESQGGPALVAGAGSLYAALDRLEEEALLSSVVDDEDSRRRRRFALTPLGRQVASAELSRLEGVLHEGRQVFPESA
jgi:DNA-binding PadR family transcriptional regulator